jgi:O-antigen ligase
MARVLLMVAIFGAPWAFGGVEPWAWAALMVLALLTLVLWALGCAQRGALKISRSPLYWPFLALLILAAVQLFAGLNADHVATREAVLKITTDLIFFFLAGQLLNAQPENGRALEWFGLLAIILALSLCIFGLAQMFWNDNPRLIYWNFLVTGWPFGPYVNHNDYAGLMEMLLPVSVAYILSRPSQSLPRLLLWCTVVLVLISVWISGSRGATIVLLVEGVLWTAILTWYRPRGASPRAFVVLLGVVLISAGAFSWLVSRGQVAGRAWSIFETNESLEGKLGDRLRVGLDTIHMARSHPGLGVGVGCFEYVIPQYLTFPSDMRWNHAHDDVLEGVAETGLPGVAMILAALWLFFRKAFRQIERRLRYGWGWIQIGAAVGAVGLLVHSFLDFNLRIPANALWFVVCLAIATHSRPAQGNVQKRAWDSSTDHSSEFLT